MKIVIDWSLCDGNGTCELEAPAVFQLDDDDNLVVLQESPPESERAAVEAAVRGCPKRAITVVEQG